MDIENLKEQIKLNCTISDARFWGYFSICGLLMRLRELYRSEKSLMPWEGIPKEEMSEWIASREEDWRRLESAALHPITIGENTYDPFEVDRLNAHLNGYGFVYGGGYGRFNKPTFFLAELENRMERDDHPVYSSGKELCRDLSTSVAMLQGRCIFLRHEQLKILLWDKFQELQARRFGGLLKEAFSSYGIEGSLPPETLYRKIESRASELSELFILHETGEAFEDENADQWLEVLSRNRDRATEFYARGVKDLLADTSERGPLNHIIRRRERPLLNFYMALLDGIRREMWPEIMNGFQKFLENDDWSSLEEARRTGYARAFALRDLIIGLWNEGKADSIVSSIKENVRKA